MNKRIIVFALLLSFNSLIYCEIAVAGFFNFLIGSGSSSTSSKYYSLDNEVSTLSNKARDLNPSVLRLSLKAYYEAQKRGVSLNKPILTIIDYSLPSNYKRMWVLDVEKRKLLFN